MDLLKSLGLKTDNEEKNKKIIMIIISTLILMGITLYFGITSAQSYAKNKGLEGMIKQKLDAGIQSGNILSYKEVKCNDNQGNKANCSINELKIKTPNQQTGEMQTLSIEKIKFFNMEDAMLLPNLINGSFIPDKTNKENPNGKIELKGIKIDGENLLWNQKNEENLIMTYGESASKELRTFLKESFNKETNLVIDYKVLSILNEKTNIYLKANIELGEDYSLMANTSFILEKNFFEKVKELHIASDIEESTKIKLDLLKGTTVSNIAFSIQINKKDFFKELIYQNYKANCLKYPSNVFDLTKELAGEKAANKNKILSKEEFYKLAIPFMENQILNSLKESIMFNELDKEKQIVVVKKIKGIFNGSDNSLLINLKNKENLTMGEIPQQFMIGLINKDPYFLTKLFNVTIN